MNFPKQVIAEMAKMLRSKFILISAVLIFVIMTIGLPILDAYTDDNQSNYYYYGGMDETIIVDGVEYELNNQFTHELYYLQDTETYISEWLSDSESLLYGQEMLDLLINFYSAYIPFVESDEDYRMRISYDARNHISDKYILEQLLKEDVNDLALQSAMDTIGIYGTDMTYLSELTVEEKNEKIAQADKFLADFDELMRNNDFGKYVDIMKTDYNQRIEDNLSRIETLEEDLLKDPSQEEFIAREITSLELSNQDIVENQIPELEYRLEHNIIYDDGSWQDGALSEISQMQSSILQGTIYKETEENFYENDWLVERYGTYVKYEQALEKEVEQYRENLFVAQSSMDSGKPDMKFVEDGARQSVYEYFSMTILISIFGVLVGGWVIASEFQSGTVRLLMIRPRHRLKVLFSKYLAGIKLVFILYFAIFIVIIITQGILNGFSDYSYPNYTASGQVNFFLMFVGHFFAVSTSMIFIFSIAFFMSIITKNMAVSIVVPTIVTFGSLIGLTFLAYRAPINALAFTFVPYINMHELFTDSYSVISELVDKGVPISIGLGVCVMLVFSAIFVAIGTIVFKKQDISN